MTFDDCPSLLMVALSIEDTICFALTLARTCYFPILEHTWGCNPHAISPLIEIELWDKDETNPWDVLSPMVPELTSLGHIFTPPGRVKEKRIAI